ncbi:MAG: hypothetical protein A3F83_09495 [Candidatus Glassbacteria bacterium RIFCSPLOWO2_12_FULL_58_11]|uniref:POTRA domain-containing protein n=1 Tax=Candidatus Glassbacteria bacterium RIFCSPLOWO2_12_FULL_58_11 TaxID=1817867 RepID=A0A1F5YY85_9BACT|nr:MAG: hypothetical protein A3F83_09495 [Candidatus Glassbacteria bacterium RIFCSPLOWO2_12_FULL_58_11]
MKFFHEIGSFFSSGLFRAGTPLLLSVLLALTVCQTAEAQWIVGRIELDGNGRISDKELLALMNLKKGKSYAEWKTEEDRAMILALYRSRGFLQAEVGAFEKNIEIENQRVDVLVRITEGLQTVLRKIEVTGNTVFSAKELLGFEEIPPGKPLDARKLNLLKQDILNAYFDQGYLYAEVKDRFYFPTGESNAEVYFDIEQGPQVKVGKIEIEGNRKIKNSVILKALEIKPGSVYSEEKMRKSKANLYRIGVLKDVRHKLIGTENTSAVIDVLVTVSEGDFRAVGVGGGIGDVDGLRGWLEWGHYNLLSRAFSLMQLTRVTYQPFEKQPAYQYSYSSSLTLRQPYFLNSRMEGSTTGYFEKVAYAHHEEEKLAINVLLRNMSTERRELSLLTELNQRNIFNVDTLNSDKSITDNRGNNITNLISPLLMRDRRDDQFNPERGYLVLAKSTLAGGPFLLGSINYYQFSLESSYIQPLYRPKNKLPLLLAGRIKLGTIREFGGTPSVPPSEAFNIGGGKNLRGYSELSVGPINDRNVAGNVLIQTNLELRYPIWHNLGGVLFLDAANVFRELRFDQRFHLLTTSGVGLRYLTPIGPLRIDGAVKLNNFLSNQAISPGDYLERERQSWGRIHFGIGHTF